MSRDRILAGAAFAALAAVAAVIVIVVWDGGGSGVPEPTVESPDGIVAYGDLQPYRVQFGDTVVARVEVTLDRSRVDPDSVRVRADFTPWEPAGRSEVLRRDGKHTTYIETRYTLRCLESFCVTPDETSPQVFTPARVSYTAVVDGKDEPRTRVLRARWPELLVTARYAPPGSTTGARPTSWEADLVSFPAASYRVGPWLLAALLAGGGMVLIAVALAILRRLRPRRHAAAVAAQAPQGPVVTPLEQALQLLEDPSRVNGSGDQRRALELVSGALRGRGKALLAGAVRMLAWSRPVPRIEETRGVARDARNAFGEEEGGGHAPPA